MTKNSEKSKYNIGDEVYLEGYKLNEINTSFFYGIITDKNYIKRSREWMYNITLLIDDKKINATAHEYVVLTKNDLN